MNRSTAPEAPTSILDAPIKAVPAVKYALAVAGIVSAIAIIATFGMDKRVAIFGTVIMLVLMSMLVIFARLVATSHQYFVLPAIVFTWFSLLLTVATASLLFTCVFFRKPIDLETWIVGNNSSTPRIKLVPVKSNFRFTNVPFNVSASSSYNCGFSNLAVDTTVHGTDLRITKIRVYLTGHTHKPVVDCDVWIYLGPGEFGLPSGGPAPAYQYPDNFRRNLATAPTQLKLAFRSENVGVGTRMFAFEHDFVEDKDNQISRDLVLDQGAPSTVSIDQFNLKDKTNIPMTKLTSGLFAEAFVWTGDKRVDIDILRDNGRSLRRDHGGKLIRRGPTHSCSYSALSNRLQVG